MTHTKTEKSRHLRHRRSWLVKATANGRDEPRDAGIPENARRLMRAASHVVNFFGGLAVPNILEQPQCTAPSRKCPSWQWLMENVEMRTEPLATKGEVISNELL